jgi:hypothetical protein
MDPAVPSRKSASLLTLHSLISAGGIQLVLMW